MRNGVNTDKSAVLIHIELEFGRVGFFSWRGHKPKNSGENSQSRKISNDTLHQLFFSTHRKQ